MTRLVDPILADLQTEHYEAAMRGSVWRRRLAWLRAILALTRVAAAHSLVVRPYEERRHVSRAFFVTAAAFVVVVAVLCAPFALYMNVPWSWLAYFAPYGLPIAIPASLVCGIVFGLGRAQQRIRAWVLALSLVASCGSMWSMAVLVPASNQAFRERMETEPVRQRSVRGTSPGPIGMALMKVHPGTVRVFRSQSRLALACAPLVLVILILSIRRGRQRLDAAIGMAVLLGYFGSLRWVDLVYETPVAKAWVPNAICMVLATGSMLLRWERARRGRMA